MNSPYQQYIHFEMAKTPTHFCVCFDYNRKFIKCNKYLVNFLPTAEGMKKWLKKEKGRGIIFL